MKPTVSVIFVIAVSLHSYSSVANCQGQAPEPSLAAQVVDPTAPLKVLTLQDQFAPSLWGINDNDNEVAIRIAIPHNAFGAPNIMRLTVPYITSQPSGKRGLSDVAIFDIVINERKWGTLVYGGVASAGPNKGAGLNTFAIGPVLGAVFKKHKWTYGIFNQNLLSFGDIDNTQLQPILAYTFSDKVSLNYGDAQFTFDWNKERFVNVPASLQVNYIASVAKQPIRLFVNPQYNIVNEAGTRKWSITTGFALIVK